MINSLISIIVPVYNSERWLEKCILSILEQTYKYIEIILVDDGSKDSSPEICDKYAMKFKKIIKVQHIKNSGVSVARNVGLNMASGEYIKFVDSDDTLEPNCCQKLKEELEENDADLVICGLNVFKNNVLLRNPHLERKKIRIHNSVEDFKYIQKVFASPCNKLYRKDLIKKEFENTLTAGEDMYFNLEYLKNTKIIICISDCLYNVCLDNEESLNRKFREDRLDISLYLIEEQRKFCDSMYNKNYDNLFLKNECLVKIHAFFREYAKKFSYSKYKNVIRKYRKNNIVVWGLEGFNLERKDYNIFAKLLKYKMFLLTYIFFKIKILISKGN